MAETWSIAGTYLESCNCEVDLPVPAGRRPRGRPLDLRRVRGRAVVGDRARARRRRRPRRPRRRARVPLRRRRARLAVGLRPLRRRAGRRAPARGARGDPHRRLGGTPLAQFPWAFKPSRQLAVRAVPIEVDHHAAAGLVPRGRVRRRPRGRPGRRPGARDVRDPRPRPQGRRASRRAAARRRRPAAVRARRALRLPEHVRVLLRVRG